MMKLELSQGHQREAALAYDAACIRLHGPTFGQTNAALGLL